MVAHGLPLPKSKTKIEADKVNAHQTEETAGVRVHDTLEVPATAAQAAPSHKHFQDSDFNLYTPVPAQAESTEKVTWRPGMIMFTVWRFCLLLFTYGTGISFVYFSVPIPYNLFLQRNA